LQGRVCIDKVCVKPSTAEVCNKCHGSEDNPAPPQNTEGGTETSIVSVGAHQTHLHDSDVREAMWCQECHIIPTTAEDPYHQDGLPAEVTFGVLSRTGGLKPSWDRAVAKCSDVYCHGATLTGGANPNPVWNVVDQSQSFCGSCHGIPPLSPHPASYDCVKCHQDTLDAEGGIDVAGGKHINGKVDVIDLTCSTCHGSESNDAPPKSVSGSNDTSTVEVGAHQPHLADSNLRRALKCEDCHVVPETINDATHMDTPPAEVTFGSLAKTDGADPSWDRNAATCSNTYCHGATLDGGTTTTPKWTDLSGSQAVCGTCHGLPPGGTHDPSDKCVDCHPATVDSNLILDIDKHMDGTVQYTTATASGQAQMSVEKLACE